MASTLVVPISREMAQSATTGHDPGFGAALVTLLTFFSVALNGYHPYAEDGGVYLAGVKRLLDPALYPHGTEFVTEHLRFSVFAPMLAGLVRASHLSLPMVLLLVHLASVWATLYAAWQLAARCYAGREARCGAVALLAAWLSMPVAGTSLMLMDPYVTARSISTPCSLLALVGLIDFQRGLGDAGRRRGLLMCCGALLVAAVLHPLMGAYAAGCVAVFAAVSARGRTLRIWWVAALCGLALTAATAVYLRAPAEDAAYVGIALTRSYWFLGRWEWYELFGLAAPLLILLAIAAQRAWGDETAAARINLARMAVVVGTMSVVIALLFARAGAPTHLIARLQPLRVFQTIYLLLFIAVGAMAGERLLRRNALRWVAALALTGGAMLFVDHQTYPDSAHVELPWQEPQNGWERAFVWISRNTPRDALFALDANYVTLPGEDAQTFRATAERSALPDYSKDGGEASITPALTRAWLAGMTAQMGLSAATDAGRIRALRPLGVDWIVLERSAVTAFRCDYVDGAVKVCRLP